MVGENQSEELSDITLEPYWRHVVSNVTRVKGFEGMYLIHELRWYRVNTSLEL